MNNLYYIHEQKGKKPYREIVYEDKQGTVDIVYKKDLHRAKGDFNLLQSQYHTYGDKETRELASYFKQEQERRELN